MSSNLPIYYSMENLIVSSKSPGIVNCHNTQIVNYFKRYLYQKAISVIKCRIPDTWNKMYLLYTLFSRGYVAVVNTNRFGVICQQCGLYGFDIYYAPTHATIANPLLRGILRPRIHVQCEVLQLTPDYMGIDDLITFYANKMGLVCETIDTNLVNSKLAYVFIAGSKGISESYKMLYDDIASGKPSVVVDKNILNDNGDLASKQFNQNLRQTYITTDLLTDLRTIENEFLTHIGIPNANTQKKERLITNEVEANNVETSCLLDFWLETLTESAGLANKMFGLNLSFEKRYRPDESEEIANE